MDTRQATNLLDELFDNNFNQDKYIEFLGELFKSFSVDKSKYINFKKQYNEYIKSVLRLGHYFDDNRDSIVLYIIELKKNSSRDRARVMQRNLVADRLEQDGREHGLVVFYNPEEKDWRFSYVKAEYDLDTETLLLNKKLSSAKRYSYLTGPDELNHSCKSRFLSYLTDDKNKINVNEFHDIFSVEKVTNEFFEKYQGLFKKLKKSLDNVVKNDSDVKKEFKMKNIETGDFAKKLLGQIVFLYFLQKKGWLGVEYEDKWGTGPKNFFEEIFRKYQNTDKHNFFDDILEPLFYKGLNVVRDRDYYEDLNCKIPFLNGGLFEPMNDYDWIKTKIQLKDNIFEEIITTFNRFNFTVKEDEPLEKEVAVDPEMLGKVFENLLEVGDRKMKGAFYTPREIVHYICKKTLINYLKNNSGMPEDSIIEFIEKGYKLTDTLIRNQEDKKSKSPNPTWNDHLTIIQENSENLLNLLNDVKVVDPAVGSGAFPVGMMNEITNAKIILKLLNKEKVNIYDIKREIIEKSLYGVDIEYFALDVAKLRFWLSLIVDEESFDEIKPLPNLDHKLMCGNSLIEEFEGIELFDKSLLKEKSTQTNLDRFTKNQSILNELRKLQKEFFNEENPNNKRKLKKEIDEKEWSIIESTLKEKGNVESLKDLEKYKKTNSKPFFLWELYFFEVFQKENPGFDIVIGNPPYVGEKGNKELFRKFRSSNWGKKFYNTKMDIFYYFYHKGIDICRKKGVISYITTNYFITADGAYKLRKDFKERTNVLQLLNFNELRIFESAKGQHNLISILEKNEIGENKVEIINVKRIGDINPQNNILNLIFNKKDSETKYMSVLQKDLFNGEGNLIFLEYGDDDNGDVLNKLLKKLENGILLKDICDINSGADITLSKIRPKHIKDYKGDFNKGDGVFVLSKDEYQKLKLLDNEEELIKPFIKNSNIEKYIVEASDEKLIYIDWDENINNYPNLKKHLSRFKEILEKQVENYEENYPWYAIHRPRNQKIFESLSKIVVPYRSKQNIFAFSNSPLYSSRDVFFIRMKDNNFYIKYILALLNSKLYYSWLYNRGKKKGEILELYYTPLSNIPIKKISLKQQEKFVELVNKRMELYLQNKNNMSNEFLNVLKEFDKELNKHVYNLYDLTDDEIKIIENQ